MDHAEVLDRLEAAAAAPGGLRGIESDDGHAGAALRRHLAGCEACATEYRAWLAVEAALVAAAPDTMGAPAGTRGRVLSAAVATGTPRRGMPGLARRSGANPALLARPAGLALSAAAVLAIFVLGALLGEPLGLAPGREPPGVPDAVAASVQRILVQPDHRSIALSAERGGAEGVLLWSPALREVTVLSGDLPRGKRYWCYLERDGARIRVGPMFESDGMAYWAGRMDEPPDVGRPGDRFLVSSEDPAAPLIWGDL